MKLITKIDLPTDARSPEEIAAMVNSLYRQMQSLGEQYNREIEAGGDAPNLKYLIRELAMIEGVLLGINWTLGGAADLGHKSPMEEEVLRTCNTNIAGYS